MVPTPPFAPATAISRPPSAPAADSSPATRSRSARDHCAAARTLRLELLERERQRDDVAQPGLHRGAQQVRRVVGGDQHEAGLGERLAQLAREVEHRHGAERVVQHDDVDVVAAQRARDLLGLVDHRDDLEPLALLRERGGAGGDVAVGDGEEQALAHCDGTGSGSRLYTRCLLGQLRRVAGPQQRQADLARVGLRVGDDERLLGRERERDRHDLRRGRRPAPARRCRPSGAAGRPR